MSGVLKTLTLGCKVNQYETEFIRQGLLGAGYRDAADGENAQLCVVNTCTVTNEGDSKSRQAIRKLARQNPDARIVVMGCYATRAPEEVADLPGVVEVVTDKRELPDLLGRFGVVDIPTGISEFGTRHRAYLKVQDGCLLNCSYCIIPQVRPHLYSREPRQIVEEARRLVDGGYRELVLTGVHLGHYGIEWNRSKPKSEWIRLSHLIQQIMQIPGDFRVRLSSIEATEVTHELIETLATFSDRVCPHLHICLQSGSDRILRRMKRRWGRRRFVDRCLLVQEQLDLPALTTDVIVGFPGETEGDFQATCDVVEQIGFSKVHIFPFSPRKGTPAAEMQGMVTKKVKSERGQHLAQLEQTLRQKYFGRLAGRQLQVLVEAPSRNDPTRVAGTSCRYAPVELTTDVSPGEMVRCTPHKVEEGYLLA